MNPKHLHIVLGGQGVQVYYRGKLVQSGPLYKIRQWIDDQDQAHQLAVHRRIRRRRNAKKSKRRNCLTGVMQLMTKEALRNDNNISI